MRARADRFDHIEDPWTTRDRCGALGGVLLLLRSGGTKRHGVELARFEQRSRAGATAWAENCYGWGTVTPISNDLGAATFEKRLNDLAHRLAATALRTGARVVQGYRGSGTATAGAVPYRS